MREIESSSRTIIICLLVLFLSWTAAGVYGAKLNKEQCALALANQTTAGNPLLIEKLCK
jgi:hypothetical protein